MAWYRIITHTRNSGRMPMGREVSRTTFEAADRDAAVAEARARARLAPKGHVLSLFDLNENRIDLLEAAAAS
jgi:hypothetical protein